MSDPVTLYLDAIHRKLKNGDATEHTHRAALQSLIERTIDGLEATNEPKSQQRENKPDYVVRRHQTIMPLWLITNDQTIPNLAPAFLTALATALRRPTDPNAHDLPMGITPEDVLAYLYAVLYSPSYRKRYAEFLKSDFPRIPLSTVDGSPFADAWATLVPLGHQLIDLHLMRKVPSPLKVQFPKTGTNEVTKPRFEMAPKAEYGSIWINEAQYFDRVPPLAWAYRIGGYQVCEKWLKDRKGRILSFDDIHHYQQMVAVLDHTQAVQQAIDVASLALWA